MSARSWIGAMLFLAASAAPTAAQSWEAAAVFGFTPSVGLDERAPELDELNIRSGLTWGLAGTRFFSPRWGVEGTWTMQDSALEVVNATGAADLFTMTVGQLHGNFIYRFADADARFQPFALAGAGVTFFSADDLETESKFSLGLGAGVKYFPWSRVGVRGQFRYKPTFINDDEDRFCEPFGFCQGTLNQIEFAGGVVIRF